MDITHILVELRSEILKLDEAIVTLQRLATGGSGKRRGRPPKWMASAAEQADPAASTAPARKRKPFSAATRKRMAEAQRKRWAARKAKAAQAS